LTDNMKLGYMDKLGLFRKDAKLFIASMAASALASGMNGVIFNLYLFKAGYLEDFIGLFLSTSLFATASVAFLAGMITDRASRKRILLTSNAISLVAVAIQYSTLEPMGLLISQALLGASSAFVQVAWSPYITDLSTERERAHLFGFSSGTAQLSVLFGNILGGVLPGVLLVFLGPHVSLLDAYRLTLWLSLLPLIISTVLVIPMTHDSNVGRKSRLGVSNVKHWGFIGRYTLTIGTTGLGAGMIVTFFSLYFFTEFKANQELIGLIFGINTVVLASGNFLAAALADRMGKVKTVILTEALSIPFLFSLSWAPELHIAVFVYVTRNVLMNMAGPMSNVFFMESLTKEERATAVGVVRTADSFVRGIASNIGGLLLVSGQYRLPYLIVTVLYVIAVGMFYAFFRHSEAQMRALRETEVTHEAKPEESADVT